MTSSSVAPSPPGGWRCTRRAGRRHRRRCRSGRQRDGGLPRGPRSRRRPPREVGLPPRQDLRRRPDAPRDQASSSPSASTRRLAAHQGPAHQGRRPHAAARLARVRRLPRLRHGPHPRPARRGPGPPRGEHGAPSSTSARASPPRSATPRAASPGSPPSASTSGPRHGRDGHLPRPGRRRERRRLEPPRHRRRPPQARGPRHGRGRPRLLHTPRRDDYLESHLELWSRDDAGNRILMPGYGWIFPLEDGRTNVGLGILDTTRGLPEDRLQGRHAPLGRGHRRRVAARARRERRPDPRRRAADGLQPHAALRRRPAPRRRRRRHGQPVQRRGHRLRPRGRAASAPRSSPRRWPARATPRASGCSRHTPRS